jgi:hypothetical protein
MLGAKPEHDGWRCRQMGSVRRYLLSTFCTAFCQPA